MKDATARGGGSAGDRFQNTSHQNWMWKRYSLQIFFKAVVIDIWSSFVGTFADTREVFKKKKQSLSKIIFFNWLYYVLHQI